MGGFYNDSLLFLFLAIGQVRRKELIESESESESVSEDEDVYIPSEDEKEEFDEEDSSEEEEISLGKEKKSFSESEEEREEPGKSSPAKNISSLRPKRSTRINYKDYVNGFWLFFSTLLVS